MLEECGLPYRAVPIDFQAHQHKSPEFLAINPSGAVPAIRDPDGPGGSPIAIGQSAAILLYLAEKTGRLLPSDPRARAQCFQWLMQAASDISGASSAYFYMTVMCGEKEGKTHDVFRQRVIDYLAVADGQVKDRPFLAGDALSVADIALYPLTVSRGPLAEAAGLSHLVAWRDRLGQRPGFSKGMTAGLPAQG